MGTTRIPHTLLVAAAFALAGCAVGGRDLRKPVAPHSRVGSPEFQQAIGSLLGPEVRGGNRITLLENGDQIFPAMLGAIRGAKRTITFETYVFEKGEVPRAFAEALAERARAGVRVHVIVDAHGGKKSRTYHGVMRDAGVEVEKYNPIMFWDIRRFNNRTHRKLLVVDGRVGFIGGVGIADQWAGNAEDPKHWRDLHFRVEGPAVAHLQGAFMDNWIKRRGELLHGVDYFPPLPARGSAQAGAFFASPRHGAYNVVLMYQLALASAQRSILIENPYFVPDQKTVDALVAARQRGVRVSIILPGRHIDMESVRRASRKRWKPLLEAGIELHEYQPTMIHTKLLIIDGRFVSIGSANLDNRSARLNDEANLNVLDSAFAAQLTRVFERDWAKSTKITLENYKESTLTEAPAAVVATPLEAQL